MSEQTQVGELEGRDLDAAVAREVMGRRIDAIDLLGRFLADHSRSSPDRTRRITLRWMDPLDRIPHYSTDINAAWEVVDRLRHYSGHIGMIDGTFCASPLCSVDVSFDNGDTRAYGVKAWRCTVTTFNEDDGRVTLARAEVECHNDDCGAPEAIARASLKAVRSA